LESNLKLGIFIVKLWATMNFCKLRNIEKGCLRFFKNHIKTRGPVNIVDSILKIYFSRNVSKQFTYPHISLRVININLSIRRWCLNWIQSCCSSINLSINFMVCTLLLFRFVSFHFSNILFLFTTFCFIRSVSKKWNIFHFVSKKITFNYFISPERISKFPFLSISSPFPIQRNLVQFRFHKNYDNNCQAYGNEKTLHSRQKTQE
jgi:hypothetical protein